MECELDLGVFYTTHRTAPNVLNYNEFYFFLWLARK